MFSIPWRNNKKGISIIEILIVIAIIAITLASLLSLAIFSLKTALLAKETTLAKNIAEATLEEVRNFRDGTTWASNGLGTLLTGEANPYHPEKDTGTSPPQWILASGTQTINGFTRKVVFDDVQRDTDFNIVESGGTVDSDTKKTTVNASWTERGGSHQVEIVTYLTNWRQ